MARWVVGGIYLQIGKPAEALSEFEKARPILGGIVSPDIAVAYALLGKKEEAQKILADLEKQWKNGDRLEAPIALVYIALGQKEKSAEWLEKLYESRFINIVHLFSIKIYPKLSAMDSDPRIRAALNKIGVR